MVSLGNAVFGIVLLVVVGGILLLGLGTLGTALARVWGAWRLSRTPATQAGSVGAGERTKLVGTVDVEDPVETPFTDRTAACAECRLEVLRKTGQASTTWKPKHGKTVGSGFLVDDGTGTVPVAPAGANVETGERRTFHTRIDSPDEAPPGVREFLDDYAGVDEVPSGDGVRYTEEVVRPDDEVLVYGRTEGRADPTVRAGDRFLVTTRSESDLVRERTVDALGMFVLGLFLVLIGGAPVAFVVSKALG